MREGEFGLRVGAVIAYAERPSRGATDLQGKASWKGGGGERERASERGVGERGPGCTRRSPPAIGPNWMKFTKPAANRSLQSAPSLQKPYLHPQPPARSGTSPRWAAAAAAAAKPGRGRWGWTGGHFPHGAVHLRVPARRGGLHNSDWWARCSMIACSKCSLS